MTTLTERYISATISSLPPAAQDDVRDELRASISDAVEARTEQGEPREEAERTVLTELGDPAALAAGYADRPLHLIGPRFYLAWWRLMKLLLAIVPACVAGALILGLSLAGEPIGAIIGQTVGVTATVVIHLFFWVTLIFAILDRTGADAVSTWSLDQLPEPQDDGASRSEMIVSLVLLALMGAALFWDRLVGFVWLGGESLPVLDPALWWLGMLGLFAILLAKAGVLVGVRLRRRWTTGLAVANTAVAVLFVSWSVTLLARGDLVNPAFLDAVFLQNGVGPDVLRILAILTGFFLVGIPVWEVIDTWMKKRRADR
ncbi:permease prefix domain 1-containing protein [Microbacterium sp. gxy059]|uniref:permease prefix domain 1-containing protein n=1 Tax=Microbacterium sp. gxy059 TaxID=2957199 RepID=UPI003D971B1D